MSPNLQAAETSYKAGKMVKAEPRYVKQPRERVAPMPRERTVSTVVERECCVQQPMLAPLALPQLPQAPVVVSGGGTPVVIGGSGGLGGFPGGGFFGGFFGGGSSGGNLAVHDDDHHQRDTDHVKDPDIVRRGST